MIIYLVNYTNQKEKLENTRFKIFNDACIRINSNLSKIFKELNPHSNCYLSYAEVYYFFI